MKSIDDIVNDVKGLESVMSKIPQKELRSFKALTNIYISLCLDYKPELMKKQKKLVETYVAQLSKDYKVPTSYFKQMLLLVESYYTKPEVRFEYHGTNT